MNTSVRVAVVREGGVKGSSKRRGCETLTECYEERSLKVVKGICV